MIQPFRFTLVLRIAPSVPSAFSSVRIRPRLLELRIRALCSSSGKILSVSRQWEELSNADICSNVPRAVTERRGGYHQVPLRPR